MGLPETPPECPNCGAETRMVGGGWCLDCMNEKVRQARRAVDRSRTGEAPRCHRR